MTDRIFKCIFPAAGYGTRFLPITKSMPKEMLPIMNKPLIHYAVEESYNAGMNDITFIVGRNKEAIVNYFDINYELEHIIQGTDKEKKLEGIRGLLEKCMFSYIRQRRMAGLGDAIKCAKHHVERMPFAVSLADDLCIAPQGDKNVLAKMQDIFQKEQCTLIAVQEIDVKDSSSYGMVGVEELGDNLFEVKSMVEKPNPKDAPSNLAIIGRYVMMPSIFGYLDKIKPGKNGELQITDALAQQVKSERVLAYKIDAKRFDCGSLEGFQQALLHLFGKV
ncbi:MAG: UTP--glucose-1-phosphate uridylyltransferase GalU [Candidatus Portiera sp.]|nr:UTP--glucose-1-phosphate uridylyltransferase GalU [Portiera sp.]